MASNLIVLSLPEQPQPPFFLPPAKNMFSPTAPTLCPEHRLRDFSHGWGCPPDSDPPIMTILDPIATQAGIPPLPPLNSNACRLLPPAPIPGPSRTPTAGSRINGVLTS